METSLPKVIKDDVFLTENVRESIKKQQLTNLFENLFEKAREQKTLTQKYKDILEVFTPKVSILFIKHCIENGLETKKFNDILEILKQKEGFDINYAFGKKKEKNTVLHYCFTYAHQVNCEQNAIALIHQGADFFQENSKKETPFSKCFFKKNFGTVWNLMMETTRDNQQEQTFYNLFNQITIAYTDTVKENMKQTDPSCSARYQNLKNLKEFFEIQDNIKEKNKNNKKKNKML